MAAQITIDDLSPFAPNLTGEQAEILIAGTTARAAIWAACILADDFTNPAANDILRVAVLRQVKAAGGVVTTQTIGPYQVTIDNSAFADRLFTDSEVAELEAMCAGFSGSTSAAVPVFSMPDCVPCWPDPAEPHRVR